MMRPEDLTTDNGTILLLQGLDVQSRESLLDLLQITANHRINDHRTFHSYDFLGMMHAPQEMKIEADSKTRDTCKLVSTSQFRNGIKWRRGSLRIPGAEIPESVRLVAKGMRLGDVVEGTPFGDYIITSIIRDSRNNGTSHNMRIRCTGEKQVPIMAALDL